MRLEELVQETRDDIKAMKESLASMDKNLALALKEIETQRQELNDLKPKVNRHDTYLKAFGIIGGIIIFFAEVMPLIEKLIR